METAQASQLQNVQPGYVPPPPTQGAPRQTLTLPQVAPQPSPETAVELPESQGQKGSLEVPQAPIERQPQTSVGRIPVTVTDGSGRWIRDLRKQDLTVYEDGTQRPILGLQRDIDTPVSIGIVVDTSGSMAWKLAAAEAALQHFVRTLNPRDQFFLMAFSDRAFLLQDFTYDPAGLNRAIGLLHAYGNTALYDAVVQGLRKVEQGRWPKKVLLIITDGMDNTSSNSLDGAIQVARRAGVLIYTVGLGTTGGAPMISFGGVGIGFGGGFGPHHMPMGGDQYEQVDAPTLRHLSDETRATTFVMNPRVTDMSSFRLHPTDRSDGKIVDEAEAVRAGGPDKDVGSVCVLAPQPFDHLLDIDGSQPLPQNRLAGVGKDAKVENSESFGSVALVEVASPCASFPRSTAKVAKSYS
jgi:hypothetical protein